jgi:hypothetical protein
VTLIAHLTEITPDQAIPDGSRPVDAANWFSGIIVQVNLKPLGGPDIPFSAIMGSSNGATRHCDITLIGNQRRQQSTLPATTAQISSGLS